MGYIGQGMTRDRALSIARLSKHQYYYRSKSANKPGRRPSEFTVKGKERIANEVVTSQMRIIKSDIDTDYGYHRMTTHLKLLGYEINHKKVYRLMGEADLLKEKKRTSTGKNYVRYRIVAPAEPLSVFEMDIKMVWVTEHRRNAYILTILDTFTRAVLHWQVGYQMKESQVRRAWTEVIELYLQPYDLLRRKIYIEVRNDNGPQFVAMSLRKFLKENHLNQVFTHPYTPQENGHIESFHNILSNALKMQVFWSLDELEDRLRRFYHTYNNIRLHGSIANLPPMLFWECWNHQLIERTELEKKKVRFRLKIPYQQLSGNKNLEGVLCLSGYVDKNAESKNEEKGPLNSNSTTFGSKITRRSSFAISK